jgi:soluble lytic murein transglycosylase-like protein
MLQGDITALKAMLLGVACLLAMNCAANGAEPSAYRLQLNSNPYRLQAEPGLRAGKMAAKPSPLLAGKPYAVEIETAARDAGLDPALVHALIHVESAYRADAVSVKGALGLMQVLPETAMRFGIHDASEPKANLKAGTRYLRLLLDLFEQRTDLALAAYNAGEEAVLRHASSIPPYPETQRYVPAVLGKYTELCDTPPKRTDYLAGTRLETPAPTNKPSRNSGRKM